MMQIKIGDEFITITGAEEKKWKRILKGIYRHEHGRGNPDRLTDSMLESYRMKAGFPNEKYDSNHDYDYWTEYGLFDGNGMTDDEIRECIDDMRYIVRSPYDCTGRPTTCWITWHRNPTGLISYIHLVTLDL